MCVLIFSKNHLRPFLYSKARVFALKLKRLLGYLGNLIRRRIFCQFFFCVIKYIHYLSPYSLCLVAGCFARAAFSSAVALSRDISVSAFWRASCAAQIFLKGAIAFSASSL